jgi:hypothetical protein
LSGHEAERKVAKSLEHAMAEHVFAFASGPCHLVCLKTLEPRQASTENEQEIEVHDKCILPRYNGERYRDMVAVVKRRRGLYTMDPEYYYTQSNSLVVLPWWNHLKSNLDNCGSSENVHSWKFPMAPNQGRHYVKRNLCSLQSWVNFRMSFFHRRKSNTAILIKINNHTVEIVNTVG